MRRRTPDTYYTEIPHVFLDRLMSGMGLAELKIHLAVARKTLGWHRKEATISYGDFQKLTGLRNEAIKAGIDAGIERGTLARRSLGGSYAYSLQLVGLPDCSLPPSSRENRPEVVGFPNRGWSGKPTSLLIEKEKGLKERFKDTSAQVRETPSPPPVGRGEASRLVADIVKRQFGSGDE